MNDQPEKARKLVLTSTDPGEFPGPESTLVQPAETPELAGEGVPRPPVTTLDYDAELLLRADTGVVSRDVAAPSLPGERVLAPFVDGGPSQNKRYEAVRVLGAGSVGEVVLHRDLDIGRPVAVKRLRADEGVDAQHRFAREVRTIGQLEHPNIVPIHDVGVDADGKYFFVMKYVRGETLEDVIRKLGETRPGGQDRMTIEARVRLFLGILQAVEYAHAHGVIHRDVKPANVMVGPFGEVMLMDWGIAKRIRPSLHPDSPQAHPSSQAQTEVERVGRIEDASAPGPAPVPEAATEREKLFTTRRGTLVGTPAYMSPEQAHGYNASIDERTDLYSLSVVFHELMTGRHYLEDKTTLNAMLLEVAHGERTYWNLVVPMMRAGCPPEFAHFIQKGLQRDPAKRFQSAAEMSVKLKKVLAGYVRIQDHLTLAKRGGHGYLRAIDTFPVAVTASMAAAVGVAAYLAYRGVRALL